MFNNRKGIHIVCLKKDKFLYLLLYKLLVKSFYILFLLILIFFLSKSKIIDNNEQKKSIFTFWEPQNNIPGYLRLCIKTWIKALPEYKLNILDYKSVKKYLGENLFHKIIYEKLPLQTQTDAIRVALLKKYGGIWMDVDTIITNGKFLQELKKYELVMIGSTKTKSQHIGFISALANSTVINKWFNAIINKIKYYRQISNDPKKSYILNKYCILGNRIVDHFLINATGKKYFRLDKYKINALPELNFSVNSSLNASEKYRLFYFRKGQPENILNNLKGIILLHNSWTPGIYKNMSEQEFLKEDILLSKLLGKILNYNI